MTAGARKNQCVYCMCMCKKDRTKSKKEGLLTCSYSACPTRLLLLLCLVRRFINRTNRGRPDGCYDTVISFHGSLSSSWALACFLLAACWSFPCNTHSCKGEAFSPDTQMVFTHLLKLSAAGTTAAMIGQQVDAQLCAYACLCVHVRVRVCVCVCVCVCV